MILDLKCGTCSGLDGAPGAALCVELLISASPVYLLLDAVAAGQ